MVSEAEPNRIWAIRDATNARAAAAYETQRGAPGWGARRPRPIAALGRAVLFVMVKDEADIIGQNLAHHYALGFRRFFILDNASRDGTAAEIAAFRDAHAEAEIFSAYDFVVGHYQAAKMAALEAFMTAYLAYEDVQPEWLFFVDADEFIACGVDDEAGAVRRLEGALADPATLMLVFHWVQCASPAVLQDVPPGSRLFETFPLTWPVMRVAVPKIAYRLGHGLRPIQGNHSVETYGGDEASVAVMAEAGFYLFHFPNRSVAQLRRKLTNGNAALAATKDRDGLSQTAEHWRTYWRWYQEHGDAALVGILREHVQSCRG